MPGTAHRYTIPRAQVGDFGVIVTCPKINKEFLEAKVENPGWSFWDFPRRPKKLRPGDMLYVVYDGTIRYAFETGSFESGPKPPVEDAEGHNLGIPKGGIRVWFEDVYDVDPPIPMKGFQGFRYYTQTRKEG